MPGKLSQLLLMATPPGKPASTRQGPIQQHSFPTRRLTHQQQHPATIRATGPYGSRAALLVAGGVDATVDPNDLQQLTASTCLRNGQQLRVRTSSARTAATEPAAEASAFTGTTTQAATTTTSPPHATATAAQGTIRATSACSWLTLVPLRTLPPGGPERALLLNGLASLARHGGGRPLLACATEQALGSCRQLGLACYNATGYHDSSEGGEVEGRPQPVSLKASLRVAVARRVLDLLPEGAMLHVTSPDAVYTSPVRPSVLQLFEEQLGGQADASMGFEQPDTDDRYYLASTAVAFVRNTEASRQIYDAWLELSGDHDGAARLRKDDDNPIDTDMLSDDVMFGALFGDAYAFCSDGPSCAALRHQAVAAVARHRVAPAWDGAGLCGRGGAASQDTTADGDPRDRRLPDAGTTDPCLSASQLYVRPSGCRPADVVAVLRAMGLWLLQDEPELGPGAAAVAAQAMVVGARGSGGSRGASEELRGRGCHARRHKAVASLRLVEA